jgi:2-succinyl-5-enolpyruvyl-6-hydroxy-3-cyclohexene-1-carboxylate synthase
MSAETANINTVWSFLLVAELVRNGVDYFCLAPGSRCAPLTTAVATQSMAKSLIHFDERGAAFHALGYARATGRPAVLITTSGTAVANAWPAVVEASMDRVPLILLTADRPPELQDSGANQTIDQVNIFGHYVRWQIHLPCPNTNVEPEVLLTTVDQAVHRACSSPRGPVHINCMFREPLAPENLREDYASYLSGLASWHNGKKPYTTYARTTSNASAECHPDLISMLNDVDRGLLVVGTLEDRTERETVLRLSHKLRWPMLPDITSGLRLGVGKSPAIPYFDALLASPSFAEANSAQAVLHIGGRLTSKRLLDWLERCRPPRYAVIADHPFRQDPVHRATTRIEAKVAAFCVSLLPLINPREESSWFLKWQKASHQAGDILETFVAESVALSEPLVARLISGHIPSNHGLFLSSSMPIRDMDAFASPDGLRAPVASNRGASGIDGTIATATGIAQGLKSPLTVLIGDLALLHDLNSLYSVRSIDVPIIVVVLNNNGGGIFSFLPIARFRDLFEPYFGTPHNLTFDGAAQMFGLQYIRPSSKEGFIEAYEAAARDKKPTLIEINTDRRENYDLHRALQESIASSLSSP